MNVKALGLVLFASVLLLSGCANDFWGKTYPERFASVQEAFPSGEAEDLKGIPEDAYVNRTYEVPYSDLFQIVDRSASQIGIDVESSNSSQGVILGKKIVYWYDGHGNKRPVHLTTKIMVKEKTSRKTEVILVFKTQADCLQDVWVDCKWQAEKPFYIDQRIRGFRYESELFDFKSEFKKVLVNNIALAGF